MLKLGLLLFLLALGSSEGRSLTREQQQQFTEPDLDTISQYIKAVLENLKQDMPNGIPQLGIPPLDPLNLPVIDIPRIQEGVANIKLGMKNFQLNGLSSFRVDKAKGDLENLGIELDIFVPYLGGRAEYDLDGKVLFFPLYGNGNAIVQVNDLNIKCKAAVGIKDMEKVQLTDFEADMSFSRLQIYLENIVGGGNLGDLVNTLLNMLGKYVYDRLKGVLLPEVNRIIKAAINNELSKVSLPDIIGGIMPSGYAVSQRNPDAGNQYVDRLMQELRPHILANNLDPVAIPDQTASFSKKILLVTVRGSARMYNGAAAGLSSIHRAGDCQFGIDGSQKVTIGCELGINGVNGGFSARAEFMGIGVGASVRFGISSVRVYFRVSAQIVEGATPNLEQFSITHVAPVGVSISGLGPLDWILNVLSNVIVNAVKGEIVRAIEQPIRQELINVLGSVSIPSLP